MLKGTVAGVALVLISFGARLAFADVEAGVPTDGPSASTGQGSQRSHMLTLVAAPPPAPSEIGVVEATPPSRRRILPWLWVAVGTLVVADIIAALVASGAPRTTPGNFGTFNLP